MPFEPDLIVLDTQAAAHPFTQRVLDALPQAPVVRDQSPEAAVAALQERALDVFGAAKRQLALTTFQGSFLKKCPGLSPGMVCCNYYVVNLIKNCVYDCSYCFLQDFLQNNPLLTAFVNVEDLLAELDAEFRAHPDRAFRVGTGEVTDSLALDDLLPYTDYLVPFFNRQSNAVLELKTKSDCVDNLLKQPNPANVIVSWSLNPEIIVEQEEVGTPSLLQRLDAARRCSEHGFQVGLHFDPVILFDGWETAYQTLIDQVFDHVPGHRLEWISLGSFRYRPNLKRVMQERHPATRLLTQEHVAGADGKFRYLRPLRNHAYDTLRRMIKQRAPDVDVYLCMETKEVWEGVTGHLPRADESLDRFFDF
ncbi:SPL family radical SAM protein [Nitrospina watsonii]|uniref:Radical SAM domain protein n=1 Tax=Nitrospina watsonii TaxID=1323948 RepID=A0ABN8VUG0_9BACT|nr:radical SAM protein [Nitrospina watsonii]CAI2717333.1 Putative Radical SAM domain protein [Nitrospina watsonii]